MRMPRLPRGALGLRGIQQARSAPRTLIQRILRRMRRIPLRRALLLLAGVYAAMQTITIAVLSAVALRRNRRLTEARFPHMDLPEVFVEDNRLKIYTYGADLFDAMLDAIASAQEHIFIESYIWKADAVGEEFKRRLIEKARQGVQVYVIFD